MTQPLPNLALCTPLATPKTPALDVEALQICHDGHAPALKNVSFSVRAGEFLAILGRSGAGKTTLLHALAGLVAPNSGAVRWNGAPNSAQKPRAALLFQQYRLVPQLTVLTNVLCGCLGAHRWWETLLTFPAPEKQRAMQLLNLLGLEDKAHRKTRHLSGGEQQRVAVARALMQQPSVLLADEPVAALDAETANEIMTLLASLNRARGVTTLCVLHDLEMTERYASRVLLLERGELVYDGPANNLQSIVRERLSWKTL